MDNSGLLSVVAHFVCLGGVFLKVLVVGVPRKKKIYGFSSKFSGFFKEKCGLSACFFFVLFVSESVWFACDGCHREKEADFALGKGGKRNTPLF